MITLAAPQIVLNASTVTSLTGDGQPLAGSGEASLLGDVTVISADSVVAGSSSVRDQRPADQSRLRPAAARRASSSTPAACCATAAPPPAAARAPASPAAAAAACRPRPTGRCPRRGRTRRSCGARGRRSGRCSSMPAPGRWCGRRIRSTAARAGCRTSKKRRSLDAPMPRWQLTLVRGRPGRRGRRQPPSPPRRSAPGFERRTTRDNQPTLPRARVPAAAAAAASSCRRRRRRASRGWPRARACWSRTS